MREKFSVFLFHVSHLIKVYFFGLSLFFIARLFFYLRLEKGEMIADFPGDLLNAFWTGARFDTMVLMYGLLLPFALTITGLFISRKSFHTGIMRFTRYYIQVLFYLFAVLLVIDIFYYDYFQSHINILFFGFFEDDTGAIMKSVWTDYPLIRGLLAMAFLAWLLSWSLKKLFKTAFTPKDGIPLGRAVISSLVFTGFFFLGMRGSVGTFPLQIDDATVSENTTINLLPMNGVFALKEAWMTRQKQTNIDGNIAWLKKIGYPDAPSALRDNYAGTPVAGDAAAWREAWFGVTRKNDWAEKHPPHVIFFMMESMSNYNMQFHSPELNLLGSLEKYWNSEIVFRKCFPYGDGTINSLEGLMVSTPVTSLAQSKNRYVSYGSSVALPFKEAGYQTRYVSGGKLGWRNINEFIPRQFFDFVEGNAVVRQAIPEAKECEWGVYDEYLFDYVFRVLEQSAGRPQLVFAMTTTNHTPFSVPDHYKPYPVSIPPRIQGALQTNADMALKNFTNLQYSNDCLGRFLEKLRHSPYARNTIVAASGDHNNLMLFGFADEEMPRKRGVPLFISVPGEYMEGLKIDTSVYTGHRDIFPTLINLALSGRRYFKSGNFLFDPGLKKEDQFSIDLMAKEAMNQAGAVKFDPDPVRYEWVEPGHLLKKATGPDQGLDSLLRRSRAYYAAMSYFIKGEIDQKRKK